MSEKNTVEDVKVAEEVVVETTPSRWQKVKTWCAERPALIGAAIGSAVVVTVVAIERARIKDELSEDTDPEILEGIEGLTE